MTETEGPAYEIPDDARVLIGTPNYTNTFYSEVHANHVHISVMWKEWGLIFNHMIVGRTFVHFARSQMCEMAQTGEWSHLLWLDDDAVVDEHILPKMLQHDVDVVIAPYPMRRPSYEIGILKSTAYLCNACQWKGFLIHSYDEKEVVALNVLEQTGPEDFGPRGCPINADEEICPECGSTDLWRDFHNHKAYKNVSIYHNIEHGGLMEVDGGGTHCMLVKTDVFNERRGTKGGPDNMPVEVTALIDKFQDELSDDEKERYEHYLGDLPDETRTFYEENEHGKPYFTMPKQGTEDMHWCYRARRKGIKIYMDCDIFAAHVGFAPVITKGFRQQIEDKGYHVVRDKQYGSAAAAVEFVDEPADGSLPVRKPGVHQDKTSSLV